MVITGSFESAYTMTITTQGEGIPAPASIRSVPDCSRSACLVHHLDYKKKTRLSPSYLNRRVDDPTTDPRFGRVGKQPIKDHRRGSGFRVPGRYRAPCKRIDLLSCRRRFGRHDALPLRDASPRVRHVAIELVWIQPMHNFPRSTAHNDNFFALAGSLTTRTVCDPRIQAIGRTGRGRSATVAKRASTNPSRSCPPFCLRRGSVDTALGKFREFFVGRPFFDESFLEDARAIAATKLLGPSNQRAVTRDLVVLDSLGRRNKRGIEHFFISDLTCDLIRLFDDAVDRRTRNGFHLHAVHLKDLLDALHVHLGFAKMLFEAFLELKRSRFFDHFREGADDPLLGVVNILELMHKKIIHRLDVLGENSHIGFLSFQL
jgi:hypothetical protein